MWRNKLKSVAHRGCGQINARKCKNSKKGGKKCHAYLTWLSTVFIFMSLQRLCQTFTLAYSTACILLSVLIYHYIISILWYKTSQIYIPNKDLIRSICSAIPHYCKVHHLPHLKIQENHCKHPTLLCLKCRL